MELLVGLLLLAAFFVLLYFVFGGVVWVIFAAGYYLSIWSLLIITVAVTAGFVRWYLKAPYYSRYQRWREPMPKNKVREMWIGATIVLGVIWVIFFFANWSGAGEFFDRVSSFVFRQ